MNGTSYHYVKNLQGDIIAIVNDSGTKVVEYTYNSWGKLISTTGSLASIVGVNNPHRYRGYRYDTETGLYYLQSRYYDPETGRFINADDIDYLDASGTVLGCNLFAYCENNPVNGYDPSGEYNRKAALAYAKKWYGSFNHQYYRYTGGGDCANFVSQCLHAGGFKMNSTWHSYRKNRISGKKGGIDNIPHRLNNLAYNWDVSSAWSKAVNLYNYYKQQRRCVVIYYRDLKNLSNIIKNRKIQQGDLMFFSDSTGKQITHATIICGTAGGTKIYYAGHSESRWREPINTFFHGKPNGAAYIVLL